MNERKRTMNPKTEMALKMVEEKLAFAKSYASTYSEAEIEFLKIVHEGLKPAPQVMTIEEVRELKSGDSVWNEWQYLKNGKVVESKLCQCVVTPDGMLHDNWGKIRVKDVKLDHTSGVRERYWSLKPTEEQRKEVEWQ